MRWGAVRQTTKVKGFYKGKIVGEVVAVRQAIKVTGFYNGKAVDEVVAVRQTT